MSTISVRVNDDEFRLIRDYVDVNRLSLSQFLRETVLDRIESDLALDEQRILAARERARTERKYDHAQVWEMLGI